MTDEHGDDGETPITSIRFPEEQIDELDELVPERYADRSAAIRRATGKMLYEHRQETGRTDAIDRIVGAYAFEDRAASLHDAVEDAIERIDPDRGPGDTVTVRGVARSGTAFYGIGRSITHATADLLETVYGSAVERAENLYGVPVDE